MADRTAGVGFYFRNVTELILFGVRGHLRTLQPGRTQTNVLISQNASTPANPIRFTPSSNPARPALPGIVRPLPPARLGSMGNEDVEANC